jgi:S-adenosyl-L-homocysteine hydrolase
MPGLMACRTEYAGSLAGARIAGSLHMTIQVGYFVFVFFFLLKKSSLWFHSVYSILILISNLFPSVSFFSLVFPCVFPFSLSFFLYIFLSFLHIIIVTPFLYPLPI